MAKIRVLIVDDHAIVRAGLRMLINPQPDMEVVGEAAEGHEALCQARAANPDVLTLDLTMPGGGASKLWNASGRLARRPECWSCIRVRRQVGGRWRAARRDPLRGPGTHLCDYEPHRQRDSSSPRRPADSHRIAHATARQTPEFT